MENFNEKALTWDNEPRRIERAKIIADEIIKSIPNLRGMIGLEYGCGTGLLSFNLQGHLKHITLIDNSEGMLNVLMQKIEKAGIHNMTPVNLDLSKDIKIDEKFDLIYMLLALHHILDVEKIIDIFSDILNPQGYICIADLDKEDGSFHGEGFVGHNGFDRYELTETLMKHGFEIINWEICYENIKKFEDGTERKYPLFLMIGQKRF